MTFEQFKERWAELSEPQRDRVRAKANWEHMTLWRVLHDYWPDKDPEPLEEE